MLSVLLLPMLGISRLNRAGLTGVTPAEIGGLEADDPDGWGERL